MNARDDADEASGKGREQLREAMELFREAYQQQMREEIEEAIALYTRSIERFPTAEGYTFRGWTYNILGRTEEAIAECMKAIEVDPTFGNPYNDISAYLIEQGRLEEALSWFEWALRAPRNESYCFPYFNMGRVYERKGMLARALECYRKALNENRQHLGARQAVGRLRGMFN